MKRNCRKSRLINNNKYMRIIGTFIVTFSIVIILAFSFFTIGTKAKEDQEKNGYKYYRQIEVQYGDTLLSIAQRNCTKEYKDYEEYIREIRAINSFYNQEVTAGSFLIVPYYDNIIK